MAPRPPHRLLQHLFKKFSVVTAKSTLLPTIGYHLRRPALPPSEKPALFTMNILPPMMTVWHHCVKKYLGDKVDVVIFDCSGRLKREEFPGTWVQPYVNRYASVKSDEFLRNIAQKRKIGWICDDDIFLINGKAVDLVKKELSAPNTASVSFRPRTWWHFEIDGKRHWPSSSYCTAFNREIFINKEHLTLAPAPNNPWPADQGRPPGRYDTGDKANEILLQKGYRCFIVPKEEESSYITGFSGLSGAVMLLWHFTNADETVDFFMNPSPQQWKGNVLYGTFAAMLAVQCIQDCYTKLNGKPYPLPALPSPSQLEKIRRERTPFLREGHDFRWIDEATARLKQAL